MVMWNNGSWAVGREGFRSDLGGPCRGRRRRRDGTSNVTGGAHFTADVSGGSPGPVLGEGSFPVGGGADAEFAGERAVQDEDQEQAEADETGDRGDEEDLDPQFAHAVEERERDEDECAAEGQHL